MKKTLNKNLCKICLAGIAVFMISACGNKNNSNNTVASNESTVSAEIAQSESVDMNNLELIETEEESVEDITVEDTTYRDELDKYIMNLQDYYDEAKSKNLESEEIKKAEELLEKTSTVDTYNITEDEAKELLEEVRVAVHSLMELLYSKNNLTETLTN